MIQFVFQLVYFCLGLGQRFGLGSQVLLQFITLGNGLGQFFSGFGQVGFCLFKGTGKIGDGGVCLFQLLFERGYFIFQNLC